MSHNAYFFSTAPRYATQRPSPGHSAQSRASNAGTHEAHHRLGEHTSDTVGRSADNDVQRKLSLLAPRKTSVSAALPSDSSAATAYVVYSPQGSRPLDGVQSAPLGIATGPSYVRGAKEMTRTKARAAFCSYDSGTSSRLLCIPPNTSTSFFLGGGGQSPAGRRFSHDKRDGSSHTESGGLPLSAPQRVLVIQMRPYIVTPPASPTPSLNSSSALSLELTVRDYVGQRRLLFSSVARSVQAHVQHSKIPFAGVRQQAERNHGEGEWLNLFLDLGSLHRACFGDNRSTGQQRTSQSRSVSPMGRGFRLKQVKLTCTGGIGVKVRRVLAMHAIPPLGSGKEWEMVGGLSSRPGTGDGTVRGASFPLPDSLRLPTGVDSLCLFIRTGDEGVLLGEVQRGPSPEPSKQVSPEGRRRTGASNSSGTRPAVPVRRPQQRRRPPQQPQAEDRRDSSSFVEVSALTDHGASGGGSEYGESSAERQMGKRGGDQDLRRRRHHTDTPPRPELPSFMREQEPAPIISFAPAAAAPSAERPSSWRSTEWTPALHRLQANLRKAVPLSLLQTNVVQTHQQSQPETVHKEDGMIRSSSSSFLLDEDESDHHDATARLSSPSSVDAKEEHIEEMEEEEFVVQEIPKDMLQSASLRQSTDAPHHPAAALLLPDMRGHGKMEDSESKAEVTDLADDARYNSTEALLELMVQRVRRIQSVLKEVETTRAIATSPGTQSRQRPMYTSPPPLRRPSTTPEARSTTPGPAAAAVAAIGEEREDASTKQTAPLPSSVDEPGVAERTDADDALDSAALELWRSTEAPLPHSPPHWNGGSSMHTGRSADKSWTSDAPPRARTHRHRRRRGGGNDPIDTFTPAPNAVDNLVLVDSGPQLSVLATPMSLSVAVSPPSGPAATPAEHMPCYSQFLAEAPEELGARMRAAKRLSYGSTMDSSTLFLPNTHRQRPAESSDSTLSRPATTERRRDGEGDAATAERRDLNTATYHTTGKFAVGSAATPVTSVNGGTGTSTANRESWTSAQTSWTFHSSPLVAADSTLASGIGASDQRSARHPPYHPSHNDERVLYGSSFGVEEGSERGVPMVPPPPPPPPRSLSWGAQGWRRPGRLGGGGGGRDPSEPGNPSDASVGSTSAAASGLLPLAPTSSHCSPRGGITPTPATFFGSAALAIPFSPHSARTPEPTQPSQPQQASHQHPSASDAVRVAAPMEASSSGPGDPLGLPPAPTPSSAGLRTPIQQQQRQQFGNRGGASQPQPPPTVAAQTREMSQQPAPALPEQQTAPSVRLSQAATSQAPADPAGSGSTDNDGSADAQNEEDAGDDGFFLVSPEDLATALAAQQRRPPRYPSVAPSATDTSTATTTLTLTASSAAATSFSAHRGRPESAPFFQPPPPPPATVVPPSSLGSAASSSPPASSASRHRLRPSRKPYAKDSADSQRFLYDPVLGCYLDLETNSFVDFDGNSVADM